MNASARINLFRSIVLALVSTAGVFLYFLDFQAPALTNFPILFAFAISFTAWKNCKFESKRDLYISALAVFLSALLVIGRVYDQPGDAYSVYQRSPVALLGVISLAFFIWPLLKCIFVRIQTANARGASGKRENDAVNASRTLWLSFAAITIAWVLCWLAMFPGAYGGDAPFWYYEFTTPGVPLTARYSPIYVSLFASFTQWGDAMLGRPEYGFAVFTAIQVCVNLFVVQRVLRFMQRHFSTAAIILTAAFYIVSPLHLITSASSVQVGLYIPCFTMALLHLFEMGFHSADYWRNPLNFVAYAIWASLSCLFRNNGVYAVLFATAVLFLLPKQIRLKMLAANAVVVAAAFSYSLLLLPALGVVKGPNVQEMISLPMQQMAYVYNIEPDKLTDQQKTDLEGYIEPAKLATYIMWPSISDSLKAFTDTELISSDPAHFAELYFGVGAQAPLAYAKAWYLQNFGLLYPDKSYPDSRTWQPYAEYGMLAAKAFSPDNLEMERLSLFPALDKLLGRLYGSVHGLGADVPTAFDSIPVVGTLGRAATYFWLLLVAITFSLYTKNRRMFIPLALLIGYTATVMLSPVILYRYVAPLAFTGPLLAAAFFLPGASRSSERPCASATVSSTNRVKIPSKNLVTGYSNTAKRRAAHGRSEQL